MTENSKWFIFFVVTGKEDEVKTFIDKRLKNVSTPFIPTVQEIYKTSKQILKREKKLFPGYVFVESLLDDVQFYEYVKQTVFSCKEIISILRYGNTEIFSIRGHEREVLSKLCNKDFCIETSKGIIIGDNVYISEGPLKGMESTIKKINRHKREALIGINFFDEIRLAKVSLEIVEKR